MPRVTTFAPLLLVGALALAGCGSSDTTTTAAPSTSAATAATATGSTAAGSATSGATAKVNANTASAAEISAALTAAGVANADKWTDEIMEYRPYPADDPTFAKLRGELAKYKASTATVDQIISVLEP